MNSRLSIATLVLISATSLGAQDAVPESVQELITHIDTTARKQIDEATFVKLTFKQGPPIECWMVSEDDEKVIVFQDDLLPWTYYKKTPTRVPSNWHPATVEIVGVEPLSFQAMCEKLSTAESDEDDMAALRRRLHAPGPSHRLLMAHAALAHKLEDYAPTIIRGDPAYKEAPDKYAAAVLADLAWLHFRRGVNLLMYADLKEVVSQLEQAVAISPSSEHGMQASDLLSQVKSMKSVKRLGSEKIAQLDDAAKAEYYVSQLINVHCVQMSQPGSIFVYGLATEEEMKEHPITVPLRELGDSAVPALIKALRDDRPTRTVYAWRDFSKSRVVWRVSDFAWNILRDISQKDFGYERVVGFTFSYMEDAKKRHTIDEIHAWWTEAQRLSPDDRKYAMFASDKFEDWVTAANYFLSKNDAKPAQLLATRIPTLDAFRQGELCELVARFGDKSVSETISQVMKSAQEPSDRLRAAIGLWRLGDHSGIPMAIEYAKAVDQAYGSWDEPVWLLMIAKTPESLGGLEAAISGASPQRAAEILSCITAGITGELYGDRREPAGSVELGDVLIKTLRDERNTGNSYNAITHRVKDLAAKALVVLRDGPSGFGGWHASIDPAVFNEGEPDAKKRDEQIETLRLWFHNNRSTLVWDHDQKRVVAP